MSRKISGRKSAVAAVLLAGLSAFLYLGNRIILVAEKQIDVFADIEGMEKIATLIPGDKVPVLDCVDTKPLIIPHIALPNGPQGYVIRGEFKIERHRSWDMNTDAPVSFSCS
ncbi:hypothetical protein [Aestuariivirga sp.]|uniref:hypothetical protein n=1 Tax=Aestuariivirga sp. TaxID=2650926 RepID=UPI0039E6CB4A